MDKVKRAGARQVAYFTDDGFAIGIAYILAILKQNDQFESMHWFDTMYHKYGAEQSVSFLGCFFCHAVVFVDFAVGDTVLDIQRHDNVSGWV